MRITVEGLPDAAENKPSFPVVDALPVGVSSRFGPVLVRLLLVNETLILPLNCWKRDRYLDTFLNLTLDVSLAHGIDLKSF